MSTLGNVFVYFIRFLRVVLGLALIATFLWALNDQKFTDENFGKAHEVLQEAAAKGIPTVPATPMEPAYEGDFVHIQGDLSIGNVHDPLTGLTLKALGVTRRIEMLQWQEEKYRQTGQTEGIWHARWHKIWSDRIIDSDSFQKTDLYFDENRDNPKKFPHDEVSPLHTSGLALGGWPLTISFGDRLVTEQPLPPEILRAAALPDGWYASAEGDYLYPPQNADTVSHDTIGAIRVRYEYTPLQEGRYSAVGLVNNGKLDDLLYERVYSLPLMAPGDVSADELVTQTLAVLSGGRGTQKNWIGYVFVGLLLCIGVLARLFPFLKGFTEAPFPKRALITVVVAAIGTAITGALV
jgi:nitrogen fixation-related uncharacterized protein